MKKYLLIPLMIAIFLTGCSQANKTNEKESSETVNQKEIFSNLLHEEDLDSYILKGSSQISFSGDSSEDKDTSISNNTVEMIKEPKTYHAKWEESNGDNKEEREEYIINNISFYRENNGEWNKQDLEEVKGNEGEKSYFTSNSIISSSAILKSLEDYCQLTEAEDLYIVDLESNPDNINEIKKVLFEKEEDSFFGELNSLKAKFTFKKDNYYPISFEWEAKFVNEEDNQVTETKQTGNYDKVNELENIEIPDQIESLLNS